MGSLGLPATAMAVRSAFALLCFALLCGLAASSVGQSETETELTKKEGEAAGNQVLVAEAMESRVARGSKGNQNQRSKACRRDPQSNKCLGRKPGKTKRREKQSDKATGIIKGKGKRRTRGIRKGKGGIRIEIRRRVEKQPNMAGRIRKERRKLKNK